MLQRYGRYNHLINSVLSSSSSRCSLCFTDKYRIQKSAYSKSKKKSKKTGDHHANKASNIAAGTAIEEEVEYKEAHSPQEEYANYWEITTDDRIEQLTQELRRSATKKLPILGSLSAFAMAKIGWYQFEFLGMPYEMEITMVFLPFAFCSLHWMSWYYNISQKIHQRFNFKLPANWVKKEGLIGGSNPVYHQLLVMNDKHNLQLLDDWGRQFQRHKILCASLCAANITIVMLGATLNPLGDPAISALAPATLMAYSCYPMIAYAFSTVMYLSPMKNIPAWKEEIVQDLGIEQ
eukprot:CAMPEP_0197044516 /NCGR_PEP_ID=MMETSP1384-20130603/20546_1 /TAXON_ID=29189 /ORGANISM="Ammonia sp." /LENGTH=291 /DNA_ID=CAMNT_0042475981 /DNA_START=20 /DNA_END=895 /DNA_ORIENTATION=-